MNPPTRTTDRSWTFPAHLKKLRQGRRTRGRRRRPPAGGAPGFLAPYVPRPGANLMPRKSCWHASTLCPARTARETDGSWFRLTVTALE